ncbi:hypothetical protein Goshw_005331 [Gossypium schwendimanii]|uniref:Zinc knuckle CX2CX4HX4C domain-containing protein n=1 Tax=Gossypium schwendimanii TaxID=34291 RepID=A0A7J9NA26_GOSSC|nr:hypothetical protein [Gossypium schwendimanii]
MVKLDVHTNCDRKERFEQLAVCVDLRKPLVAIIRINGRLQQVECEALPNICFKCGLYRHGADLCSGVKTTSPTVDSDCVSQMIEKSGIERRRCFWWFAALGDFRGENLIDVDGKIDEEMEERNQRQIKGVGGNGVLGLQMTESGSMDTKANKRAKRGRPPDEMMENHLRDLVELKSAMEGLVCDLERTSKKTLMEGGSQIVEERIVVEDTWNDE